MGLLLRSAVALLFLGSAFAQSHLELTRNQYQIRAGQPVTLEASSETTDFILKAKSKSIEIDGAQQGGLAIGPNRASDQVLLAASLRLKPGKHEINGSSPASPD